MNCMRCSAWFEPKRFAQVYCSRRCRVADAVSRHRSDYARPDLTNIAEKRLQAPPPPPVASDKPSTPYFNPHGPTPGALQGDEATLEYYEDGYPKLPACLDRRPIKLAEAA